MRAHLESVLNSAKDELYLFNAYSPFSYAYFFHRSHHKKNGKVKTAKNIRIEITELDISLDVLNDNYI